MPLKVTVTMPDFPDDMEIGVNGLGVFTNGQAREVTDDQELMYYLNTGTSATEGIANTGNMKSTGTASLKDSDLPELPSGEIVIPEPVVEEPAAPEAPATPPDDSGGGT